MQPRGIRNNNFGNIEDGPFARGLPGYVGSDGRFAQFATPDAGMNAMDSLLQGYGSKHGINTISGIIGRWAPTNDGNDVGAYAAHVAKRVGVDPNQPIDLSDPSVRKIIAPAMAEFENGAAPMKMAFADNTQGSPTMADTPAPALSARNIAGNGVLTDPSVAQRMWDSMTDPAFGGALQEAGSYLTSIADPKGGAAMLAASKTPTNRFSVGTDKLGRQFIFDTHRGTVYDQYGNVIGPGAKGAQGATAGGLPSANVPNSSDALAQTPAALEERAKNDQKDTQSTLDALREGATQAKALQDRAEEALRLVHDPNVSQGAFGNAKAFVKNAVGSLSGGTLTPDGTDQSEALKKSFAQLQGQYLSAQKGVRFAGPEIKFSELANPDLDKPAAVNAQILQDYIRQADLAQKAFKLANDHYAAHGVLGPNFNAALMQLYKDNPTAVLNAVQPTTATSAPQGLPKGVKSISVVR
jgi:hypothetical protein